MIAFRTLAVAVLTVLAASPVGGTVPAQQELSGRELEERTRAVSSELRCVVCQGLSIQDSPAELAQQMKAVVREQLAAGRTPEQVKTYFVEKYGEWVLLQPEATGFNLAVYLLPLLILLGGAGLIVVVVRRWTRAAPDDSTAVPTGERRE